MLQSPINPLFGFTTHYAEAQAQLSDAAVSAQCVVIAEPPTLSESTSATASQLAQADVANAPSGVANLSSSHPSAFPSNNATGKSPRQYANMVKKKHDQSEKKGA